MPIWTTYFLQGEITRRIKIGQTKGNGKRRIKQMQAVNADTLVLLAEAIGKYERFLHDKFAAYRLHGEWFVPAREVLETVAWIKSGDPTLLRQAFGDLYQEPQIGLWNGQRIKRLREDLCGESQVRFAREVGACMGEVRAWEEDECDPPLPIQEIMATMEKAWYPRYRDEMIIAARMALDTGKPVKEPLPA